MNPWIAVLRALPITFVVYASSTLLAAAHALPTGLAFEPIVSLLPSGASGRVAAIEGLVGIAPALQAQGLSLLLAGLGYALLSPWLQMAWFAALSAPRAPGAALAEGARLVPRAFATSLLVGLGALILLAPCAAGVWLMHSWFESRANVRVQDLATLLALVPAALVLFVSFAWHDLARARCLSVGAFRSSVSSLGDALRPSMLARYALWTSLGLGLSLVMQLGSLAYAPHGGIGMLLTLALVQGAALARSMLRSRWLTEALLCADARASNPRRRKGSA